MAGGGKAAPAAAAVAASTKAGPLGAYSASNPNGSLPGQIVMGMHGGIPQYADAAPQNQAALTAAANAAAAAPQPIAHSAPAAAGAPASQAPAPTLQDYLNALVGQAPTAPSATDFGPAPTIGDFFSATPYQQALQAVASAGQTATGGINSAYNNAASQLAQEQQFGNSQAAGFRSQSTADQANTANQIASIVANANRLAGGNAGLGGLQGTVAAQQGVQNNFLNSLDQLRSMNNSGFNQALTANQQGALGSLSSAMAGENNKINVAQANDQAQAQRELQSALGARGTAEAKANSDYATALNNYNGQKTSLLKTAEAAAQANAPTNSQAALNQIAAWQGRGQNILAGALNGILTGKDLNGNAITNSQGQKIAAASNLAEAQNYLNNMYQSGAFGPAAYNALKNTLTTYYTPGKTQGNLLGVLAQMAGG